MSVGSYDEWMDVAAAQKRGASSHDADKCIGLFYNFTDQDMKATEREGRAVYRTRPMVEIRIPGSPRAVQREYVNDAHKQRFPKAWEAFERQQAGPADGTPLEEWPFLNGNQVAMLKHNAVYSVEQLSAVSDGNLKNLGLGARELRERAKQYLAGPSATEKSLREQLAERDERIGQLEAKVEQLLGHAVDPARVKAMPDAASAASGSRPRRARKAA